MATYVAQTAVHQTLTASTVDTVTLQGGANPGKLTVLNRTGTSEIYGVWWLPSEATPPEPAVGAVNTFCLPASISSVEFDVEGGASVMLISAGAMAYSVEVL